MLLRRLGGEVRMRLGEIAGDTDIRGDRERQQSNKLSEHFYRLQFGSAQVGQFSRVGHGTLFDNIKYQYQF